MAFQDKKSNWITKRALSGIKYRGKVALRIHKQKHDR